MLVVQEQPNHFAEVIDIVPLPPSPIQGPAVVCESSIANYFIPSISNADSYNWTVTGGVINTGQDSNKITVSWNSSGIGTLEVTPINTCGSSPIRGTLDVIINPFSTATVVDSIFFNNSSLAGLTTQDLVFNHCATSDNCPAKTIHKAKLLLEYNTGEEYNYGENAFVTNTQVEIIAYGGLDNTGAYHYH